MPNGMRATSPQNCLSFGDTGGNQLPVISQLFLLLKLIKAFLIHNQYIKVPLFYKIVHQYFMVLIIYVLLQKQMEPYSTHVLERVNRGERKPELQILGFSNQPFWAPDSNLELWEAEWRLEDEPPDQTLQEGGSGLFPDHLPHVSHYTEYSVMAVQTQVRKEFPDTEYFKWR